MELIVAGAKWLFGAKTVAATVARAVVVSTITAKVSEAMTPTPRPKPTALKGNPAGGVNYQQIVLGEVKTGGQKLTEGISGSDKEYYHLATLHSLTPDHGSAGIQGVYVNGEFIDWSSDIDGNGDVTSGKYQGLANFRRYTGDTSQTVDSTLNSALTSQGLWSSDAVGHGLQYLASRFYRDPDDDEGFQEAFGTWPEVEVLSRGALAYDPRLDSTNGGSGSHRLADTSTWEYTTNPALLLVYYLLLDREHGGVGEDSDNIVWSTVAAAANRCEETIDTGVNAYDCSIALNTGNSLEENIQSIVNTMQGAYVPTWEGIKIYAGQYDAPSKTIDHDWGIQSYTYHDHLDVDSELYNTVKAIYTDPSRDYRQVACQTFRDSSYISADQQEIVREVSLPGVNHEKRAQYITQVIGKRSRYPKKIKMALGMKARQLEPWDTVTVNFTDGNLTINFIGRVIDTAPTESGAVVTIGEENTAIWDVETFIASDSYSFLSRDAETPPTPTGLSAQGVADGINLQWDSQSDVRFEVHRAGTLGGTYSKIWEGVANSFFDEFESESGKTTRYYKIRAVRYGYVKSSFTAVVNATNKPVADGANAVVHRSGAGAPSSGLGNDGDTYLDTTNGQFYAKDGGSWSLVDIDALNLSNGPAESGADVTGNNTANDTSNVNGRAASTVAADSVAVSALRTGGQLQENGSTFIAYSDATNIDDLKPADASATAGADWSADLTNRPTELTDGRVSTGLDASANFQGPGITTPRVVGAQHLSFHQENLCLDPHATVGTHDGDDDPHQFNATGGGSWARGGDGWRFLLSASTNLTVTASMDVNERGSVRCPITKGEYLFIRAKVGYTSNKPTNGTWRVALVSYRDRDGSAVGSALSSDALNNSDLNSLANEDEYTAIIGPAPAGAVTAKVSSIRINSDTDNTSGNTWGWLFYDLEIYRQRGTNDVQRGAITNTRAAGLLATSQNQSVTKGSSPLTASETSGIATISIAAWTRKVGDEEIDYNSGSIGSLSTSTTYYVYADDDTLDGGSVTYVATTNKKNLYNTKGRIYIDKITTPAGGAGNTGGDGDNQEP